MLQPSEYMTAIHLINLLFYRYIFNSGCTLTITNDTLILFLFVWLGILSFFTLYTMEIFHVSSDCPYTSASS